MTVVGVILCALPFLYLIVWGMEMDRRRQDDAEWRRFWEGLIAEETARRNRTAEEHTLMAVLSVEKKLINQYFGYRHLTYGQFLDDVVRGKIPFEG